MKNLITYLSRLRSPLLGSRNSDVSLHRRLTVGSLSGTNRNLPLILPSYSLIRFAVVLCLLVTIGIGNTWGDPYHTLDFTAKTASGSTYSTTYWTYGSWSINQCANNSKGWAYMRCGGKASSSSTTATKSLTSNFKGPKIESKIAKIVFCHKGISNSNVTGTSITITAYSDSKYTSSIWTQTRSSLGLSTGGTSDTIQFVPSSDIAKDSYYIVSITSTVKGKSNMGVDVEKVEFYAPSGSTVTLSKAAATNGSFLRDA